MDKISLQTPLGKLDAYATAEGVCLITLAGLKQSAQARSFQIKQENADNPHLIALKSQLEEYFAGKRQRFFLPLVVSGTELQKQVWQAINKIPFGKTVSYKELAQSINHPKAARAIANACGANNLPLVIPCHRVVASNGGLGGYSAGGVENKKWLLEFEARAQA